ncbi:restriction endonuclease subunit S [Stenotrophomonas sp. WHRI 8082]|uniref:restriction endonuclease subunit S n=1 Tax=Stenotrophomonas sp. WHRI 8082 TaxID=3162571 RepID=UPI0032F01B17
MSDEWTTSTIGALIAAAGGHIKTGPFGTTLKAKEYTKIGVPLISVGEIGYGKIQAHEKTPRVSPEVVNRLPEYVLRTGDIVFARKGAVDRSAMVSQEQDGWFLGSDGIRLRPPESIDSRFLAYQLQSDDSRRWIIQHATGTTMASLNQGVIDRIPIVVPPLHAQRSIASILGSLDGKIEIDCSINRTLEAMAQAIFKSWFIDFDPVKAKIAAIEQGQDPLRAAMRVISGKTGTELDQMPRAHHDELAAIAALFPDAMEESELGEIPRGWSFRAADLLTEVGIGKTPPRKEPHWFTEGEGYLRWVSIKDMGASGVFQQRSSEFLTSEAVSRFNVRVVPDRTVLLSFKLTIGRVSITDGPMVTNEAIAHFKLLEDSVISAEYLYLYLKGFDYSMLGSTSSIADAVNSKTIREMPILLANSDLIDCFTTSVTPIFEEVRNRQDEIAALGATRDTLLPKLLSGEIEVSE